MIMNVLFDEFPMLETERFLLRETEEKDWESIFETYSDEEAVKYQCIPAMKTVEQAKKSVGAFQNGYRNKRFVRWCIARKKDDKTIGFITLHHMEPCSFKVEVGYMLNRKFWRQNVMSEAAGAVLDFAFKKAEMNRIGASVHPDNEASIRLCEKLGFEREGLEKQAAFNKITDGFEDRAVYGLLKEKWMKRHEMGMPTNE